MIVNALLGMFVAVITVTHFGLLLNRLQFIRALPERQAFLDALGRGEMPWFVIYMDDTDG